MIIDAKGNLLKAEADALVNTVNTVGIMGKGIALQFKKAFPDLFVAYKRACDQGEIQPGRVHVYATGRMGPRFIFNFPTKRHWRSKSRLEDIRSGLTDLAEQIRALDITSIAVPPLGCGHGGLDWAEVRPLIVEALGDMADVDVMVYAPEGAPSAAEIVNRTDRPNMTIGRAALVGPCGAVALTWLPSLSPSGVAASSACLVPTTSPLPGSTWRIRVGYRS